MVKLTPGHEVDAVVSDAEKGGVAVVLDGGLIIQPDVINVCLKLHFQLNSFCLKGNPCCLLNFLQNLPKKFSNLIDYNPGFFLFVGFMF